MIKLFPDGTRIYYNSKEEYHRENSPAIIYSHGVKFWYVNGLLHREDGPAAIYANGDKSWYKNGKRHREDGPAVEIYIGVYYWYIDGERIPVTSQQEFERYIKLLAFI